MVPVLDGDTPVAAFAPSATVAVVVKFAPVIVTAVPPFAGPLFGDMLLTAGGGGGAVYVKPLAREAFWLSGLVTATVEAPAAPAGVEAVIVELLTTVTAAATLAPTVTVAPVTKFDPVIVIGVPPVVMPAPGAMLEIVGAGNTYVKPDEIVAL